MRVNGRRTTIRSLATAAAVGALVAGAGVSSAAADPWLSWTVIDGATPGGVLDTRVLAADATGGSRLSQAARGAAVAAASSDDGSVTAYLTQTRAGTRDRARPGLAVVVDGVTRTQRIGRPSGQPDVTADGSAVVVGRSDGSVVSYAVATGQVTRLCGPCLGFRPGSRLNPRPAAVALSPDRQYVAVRTWTDGDAEALVIHRTSDGARVARRTMGEGEPDIAMSWTPDSRQLAYVALGSLGAPDFAAVWRVVLLGVDGSLTDTPTATGASNRLSGPMRVGSDWYFVISRGSAPTARRATVLRTTSLSADAVEVGTVVTRGRSGFPFVGYWAMSGARPAALG